MEILPINATELLQEPDKAALRLVHTQIENSQEAGQALYFANESPRIRRPDFLLGLVDRAYFALQVAVQPHGVRGGKLVLVPAAAGVKAALSLMGYVSARSVGISKDVQRHMGYRIFVIPVAVFVGEDPDNTVQAWAIEHDVGILFGTDQLMEQLVVIAEEYADQIYTPPTMAEIREVMGVFNAEALPQAVPAPQASQVPIPDGNLTARQVIIQHADTVNVYTVGAGADGAGAVASARNGVEVDLDMP